MNILKRSIAPVTDRAWEEISEQAGRILKSYLTARRFVSIDGPHGLEMGGVSTGRLVVPEDQQKEGVNYGIREYLPVIEVRKPFELDMWELDNIDRGARDIDLEPLEEAAKDLATFEDHVIYEGFDKVGIKGLKEGSEHPAVNFPEDPDELLKTIAAQIIILKRRGVQGPYDLVTDEGKWQEIMNIVRGYPFMKQLREMTGGKVFLNHCDRHSFLVPERGGDLELTLGQDISIGYDGHDSRKVKLYFTESFTFRILSPEAFVVLR